MSPWSCEDDIVSPTLLGGECGGGVCSRMVDSGVTECCDSGVTWEESRILLECESGGYKIKYDI